MLTEYKTVYNIADLTFDGLSKGIARAIDKGRGQAGNIIADVRNQAGVTLEIAKKAIERAYGFDRGVVNPSRGPIQSIRIIGPSFDITQPNLTLNLPRIDP